MPFTEGFKKTLEQRRHGSMPERKQKQPMLGPAHVLLRSHQSSRYCAGLEFRLRAQELKLKLCYLDAAHLVPRCRCAISIGIGHRMQQVIAR